MPRLPQFDREDVLTSAMEVFWTYGYEASSIQKLLDAMQINRGSMYACFGDKRALFYKALERYSTVAWSFISDVLMKEPDARQAIRRYFYAIFLQEDEIRLRRGCLLFNTVTELSESMPDIARDVGVHIAGLRKAIYTRLQDGQRRGQISPGKDAGIQADILIAMNAGLCIHSKMGANAADMKKMIDTVADEL